MQPAAQIYADLHAAPPNAHLTNMFEDEMFTIFLEILCTIISTIGFTQLAWLKAFECVDARG